jgi:biopolymer transport protein ExbB
MINFEYRSWRGLAACVLASLLFAFWLSPAFAQAGATGGEMGNMAPNSITIGQIMHTGGGVMYVLAGASVLTLAFVLYFLYIMRVGYVVPQFLCSELIEKIKAGAIDDARKACEYQPCPLSAVVLAALNHIRNMPGKSDPVLAKDIMEGEGARQADEIQGKAQYLLDIAVLSPMLGLLGTVIGMLEAFNAVALENAVAKPVALAGGVSKALFATVFGLIVGIPAMGFYGYFRRKASKVVSDLEVASLQVYAALFSRSGK